MPHRAPRPILAVRPLPTAPITPTVELPDVGGIIPCMRRMLSFFLVVLLALRGLAGDAMAMGTLPAMGASTAAVHHSMPGMDHGTPSPSSFLASTVQADSHGTAHGPQGHHTEHADRDAVAPHHSAPSDGTDLHAALTAADRCAAPGAQSASGCEHSHGAPCAACVVCHSAVSPMSLPLAANDTPPHAQPVGGAARFASAQPLQASNPPIF